MPCCFTVPDLKLGDFIETESNSSWFLTKAMQASLLRYLIHFGYHLVWLVIINNFPAVIFLSITLFFHSLSVSFARMPFIAHCCWQRQAADAVPSVPCTPAVIQLRNLQEYKMSLLKPCDGFVEKAPIGLSRSEPGVLIGWLYNR